MSLKRPTFLPLEGSELESATDAISRAGLSPGEFVLEERRTHNAPGFAVHKLVSIKRNTNGTQRQYNTGRGGGWPFEFERDLRCGFYGGAWPCTPGIAGGVEAAE